MRRKRRMNMLGSTEEFLARRERWAKRYAIEPPDGREARRRALLASQPDGRITRLYEQCRRFNEADPSNNPWEVGHVRPLAGTVERPDLKGKHEYANLRLERRSDNERGVQHRTELEIAAILLQLKAERGES